MQPTAPELEILKLLWQTQPRTARELHDEINQQFDWSYSSTRKTLERMGEKGLVTTDTLGNRKIYHANVEKVPTLAGFAQDFAKRVLELKGPLPVAMFADSELMDDKEIADLEKLLKDLADNDANDNENS
ncbi:BlaI/MecI/CopY family transcriptional regulator [Thalassotalea fusca]